MTVDVSERLAEILENPEDMTDEKLLARLGGASGVLESGAAVETLNGDTQVALRDRVGDLWAEAHSRSDIDMPECPHCGSQEWTVAVNAYSTCSECEYVAGDGLIEELRDTAQEIIEELRADELGE